MSTRTLFRLSGYALIIGFVLIFAGQLLQLLLPPISDVGKHYTDPLFLPSYLLFWSGSVLQVLALPGFYARLANKIGLLGLIGFVLTLFGLIVVELGVDLAEMSVFPPLAAHAQSLAVLKTVSLPFGVFLALLLLFLGSLLFGIALLRGKELSRVVGIILIAGAVVSVASLVLTVLDPVGVLLAHFALAYGGLVLIRQRAVSDGSPIPAAQMSIAH